MLTSFPFPLPNFLPIQYDAARPWSGHIPFAHDLMIALRPRTVVELGTHLGDSYFCFCQTVLEAGLDSVCYAVDHWHGERHAGLYGEEVFDAVRTHNESFYRAFSYLLRTTFDDAANNFSPETIDLLHIDGLHTYEAVKHDFELWFPKVRPGGIILFHDIIGRHADFGVWRLWEELQEQFAETFSFQHSWGLGVLRKPGPDLGSDFLRMLFSAEGDGLEHIRRHYVLYSAYLNNRMVDTTPVTSDTGSIQLCPFGDDGYTDAYNMTQTVTVGTRTDATFVMPAGAGLGRLRLRCLTAPCMFEISDLSVSYAQGETLWSATVSGWQDVEVSGSALILSAPTTSLACFWYGDDAYLTLPFIGSEPKRVVIAVNVRVNTDLQPLAAQIIGDRDWKARAQELDAIQVNLTREASQAHNELTQAHDEVRLATERIAGLERQLAPLHELEGEASRLRAQAAQAQETVNALVNSFSWKLTKPGRTLMSLFRGRDLR